MENQILGVVSFIISLLALLFFGGFFFEKVKLKIRRIKNEILYNSRVCKKQDGRRESH